jgi:hypothetical protein
MPEPGSLEPFGGVADTLEVVKDGSGIGGRATKVVHHLIVFLDR